MKHLVLTSKIKASARKLITSLAIAAATFSLSAQAENSVDVVENITLPARSNSVQSYINIVTSNSLNVYYPTGPQYDNDGPLPTIVLLPAFCLENVKYDLFCRDLAKWGFVVAAPNLIGISFIFGATSPTALPDQFQVDEVLAKLQVLNNDSSSPLFNLIDTSNVGLMGHSLGGVQHLYSLGGYTFPFGFPPFSISPAVKAIAGYGTSTVSPFTGQPLPINQNGIPYLFLQGANDNRNPIADVQSSIDAMTNGDTYLITIQHAGHFSITDDNQPYTCPSVIPPGSEDTPDPAAVPNSVVIKNIAKFTALFFRSYLNN